MESITNEFYMKKIVITGASSGIGSCCANYFLNCGAQVALVGRDVEGMKLIAKQYSKNATIIKCDLTQDVQVYDLKSSIVELFGSIDILINCAGLKLDSDIEKTFPQDYDYSININLRSVFLLIKNLSKFFSPNGSIVNVSCLYGTRPMQGLISFCMGKAGLEAFTKSAAGEFASEGIRVNCVSCCPLFSNSLRYAQTHEGENMLMEEKMKKNVPLGRMAYPSEPAKTIVFLCSKRASSITGQIIKVDGGRNLTSSGYVHYKGYRNEVVEKMSEDELDKFILNKIKESNFSVNLNNDNENEENQSNNDNGNDNPEDKNNEENENEENEDENENEEKDNDDENNDNENNDDNDNDNDNEDNNNDDDDNNNNNYL